MQTTPLHTAAKQLIDTFKRPEDFISFLCDLINAANQYPEPDHQKNGIFLLQRLIQRLAISWSVGGTEEDKVSLTACELKNLHKDWGTGMYYEELGYLSLAQIHDANTTGNPSKEYAAQLLQGMQALYAIGAALNEYDSKFQKVA